MQRAIVAAVNGSRICANGRWLTALGNKSFHPVMLSGQMADVSMVTVLRLGGLLLLSALVSPIYRF